MQMTRKLALLDYHKCRPGKCDNGICTAAHACSSNLLKQESPYTVPEPEPFACRACGDCVRACSRKAIRIVSA